MPAAVCSEPAKHRRLRRYERGVVAWKSDRSKGKYYAFSFSLTDGCVGRKVPTVSLRQVMVVLGDTKLTATLLCWCHITVQGRGLSCGCMGHVPQTQQGTRMSPPPKAPSGPQLSPPGLGLGFPASQRFKVAFCATSEES